MLRDALHAAVVVGSVTIDRNVFADRTLVKVGGAAAYAGLTYRRHALATHVVCNVAPADDAILSALRREGILVSSGRTARTTRFVNRVAPAGRTQAAPSLAAPIRARQIAAVLPSVDCLHLGPLHPDDIDPRGYALVAEANKRVVLDVQGLVRRVDRGRIVPAASEHLTAALRAADIVKADADELQVVLAGCGAAIETLMDRFGIAEWVVTRGPRGGCIHLRGSRPERYEPTPAGTVGDPTGAGDVFLAAYTAARFKQGEPPAAAGRLAARLAAEHVAGRFIAPAALDASRLGMRLGMRLGIDNAANDV